MTARPMNSFPNPALRTWWFAEGVCRPRVFYRLSRRACHVFFPAFWKARVFNRHVEPAAGPVVYMCNHQSFLDPMLMGMALRRPVNYMARDTLFRNPLFRRLITSVNSFPVRRGTADVAALKEAARRIARGGQVAVFPEGTRTRDGRIGPFLPGVALLARRAGAVTVPVLIDGAFECWPRHQLLPGPGEVVIQYGRPIGPDAARAVGAKAFVGQVRAELIAMQADVRRRVGRPEIRYDRGDGEMG